METETQEDYGNIKRRDCMKNKKFFVSLVFIFKNHQLILGLLLMLDFIVDYSADYFPYKLIGCL